MGRDDDDDDGATWAMQWHRNIHGVAVSGLDGQADNFYLQYAYLIKFDCSSCLFCFAHLDANQKKLALRLLLECLMDYYFAPFKLNTPCQRRHPKQRP